MTSHVLSVQVEVADGLAGGSVLGLFHGFFKFLGEDVFLIGFLEPGVGELVLTLALLLLEDSGGLRQIHIGTLLGRGLVREDCTEDRINHQLGLAAWTGDAEVFAAAFAHTLILRLCGA